MQVSSDTFRIIILGLAVIAVSFQVMDQRVATARLLSIPEPNNQAYEEEREQRESARVERELREQLHLRMKVERLEAVLEEKNKQERMSAQERKKEQEEHFLQAQKIKDHQDLKTKVERLKVELEEKSKQERTAALELKKAQEKQIIQMKDSQQKAPAGQEILEEERELLHPKSCSEVMQRMHDWNDCWRRHLMTTNGQPWKRKITCPIPIRSGGTTRVVSEEIGAPLYEFAYFAAQGFGQFVQKMNNVCMLAFLLKRPCLMNKAPRDPYNNWGSFIAENTYHWDPSALHEIPQYANQLEEVAQKLPKMGHGIWGDAINETDYEKPESLIFPMNRKFEKTEWHEALTYYAATRPALADKVLFAPNWGDAYSVPFGDVFATMHTCDSEQLASMIQNAMFGPTDLSMQLHQERYERADATVWNPEEKAALYNERKNTVAPAGGQLNPAVRTGPHLPITRAAEDKPSYGAIHIRTVMINGRYRRGKPPIETEELADVITDCMEIAKQLMESAQQQFPEAWWFIADNAPTAVDVAEEFQKRGKDKDRQSKSSLPALKIFNDYGEIAAVQMDAAGGEKDHKIAKDLPSFHSLSRAATGMYGHVNMAGSIMDWMALHEAKVSIVTGDTGYGTSGSRGNNKSVAAYCGEGKPATARQLFKILIERK